MARFPGSEVGNNAGEVEQDMQRTTSQREVRRHVEPILDASGTLKRHAMTRLDDGPLSKSPEIPSLEREGDR